MVNNRNEYSPYKTILVHGHTPTVDGYSKGRIEFGKKYINVDCGCVYRKQGFKEANLAAIRLEDLEEFYLYKPVKMPEENQKYKDDILKVRRKYKPRIDEDFLYTLFENIGENQIEDLEETFEIPEPTDDFDFRNNLACLVNNYGRFRCVFDDEETAKKVISSELKNLIYPYTYLLNDEELEEWIGFVKQYEQKER